MEPCRISEFGATWVGSKAALELIILQNDVLAECVVPGQAVALSIHKGRVSCVSCPVTHVIRREHKGGKTSQKTKGSYCPISILFLLSYRGSPIGFLGSGIWLSEDRDSGF